MNHKISLILITKNEQKNISRYYQWLKTVKNINQIVLVDDNSKDNTLKTLKTCIDKHQYVDFYKRNLDQDFSSQRQFAVSHTKNDWILWLDADEEPSTQLIQFLQTFNPKDNPHSFSFERQEIFWDHKLNHGQSKHSHIRLFNKNYGYFSGKVHETWISKFFTKTNYIFFHHNPTDLTTILNKINSYSSIRAKELYDQHISTNLFQIIFYPIAKFLQNYIFRFGFLDKTVGIIVCLLMSFHSFLVRAKLWHLSKTSSST